MEGLICITIIDVHEKKMSKDISSWPQRSELPSSAVLKHVKVKRIIKGNGVKLTSLLWEPQGLIKKPT